MDAKWGQPACYAGEPGIGLSLLFQDRKGTNGRPIMKRSKGRKPHSKITDGQDRTVYLGTNTRMARAIWGVMLVKSAVVRPVSYKKDPSFFGWPWRSRRTLIRRRRRKSPPPDNWRETGDVRITVIIDILFELENGQRKA